MKALFLLFTLVFFNCSQALQNDKIQTIESVESDALLKYSPERKIGDTLLVHNFMLISYSRTLKNPEWAIYKLNKERITSENNARRRNFEPDPALKNGTAGSWDYSESGYDRGHIVPAEDMDFSEDAMRESFFMSNVSPQLPSFNRGIWKKLENAVRKNAAKKGDLIIISGCVFKDGELTEINNGVAVPNYFYKILLHEDGQKKSAIAFVLPHAESQSNLSEFAMSVREAEKICGFNFFHNYGTSTDFENVLNKADWIIN